jgi:hypothetical protein
MVALSGQIETAKSLDIGYQQAALKVGETSGVF